MRYLGWVVCFGLSIVSCKNNVQIDKTEARPNIIWLVAEDQSSEFFPMYGDSSIALPNLEMLAKDGVVYDNAYAPVPVCAPARSSLITGMYPATLGTHNMRTYSKTPKDYFDKLGITNYSPIVPEGVRMFTEYLREVGYYTTNNSKEDYNFRGLDSAWDISGSKAQWTGRKEGQPFFAVYNFGVCHESGIWKHTDSEKFVNRDSIPVPPIFPQNDTVIRNDLATNYSNLKRMDNQIGSLLKELKESGMYDNTIIFFYGDHGGPFPRYKRALYETGLRVPLIVKFLGNKKQADRSSDFISFVDFAPSVLSLAGIKAPQIMQGMARFGKYEAPKREYIFSTSDRFDGNVDRIRAVRYGKYKYIRNFNINTSNALDVAYRMQMPMMRQLKKLHEENQLDENAAKWFHTPKPVEELYNLEEDPYELHNMAASEDLVATLDHLRSALDNWMVEINDLGNTTEKELNARWLINGKAPKLNPIQFELKNKVYILKSDKKDATIIWRYPSQKNWNIYTQPLAIDSTVVAKSVRIGFQDSDVVTLQAQNLKSKNNTP
ncbi:sulfatase [Cellulophaga sp. F20128]|uniref:sulfatase family protein n=1 Tax=Cellulophaga sp. F20128 TaxID=2926413 RepID=UPI001FF44D1D|nr:sulfatase [Cellulophaga sp. F20128]MCK0156895.1 sulfatase [Cellulophaga sp. F20128]